MGEYFTKPSPFGENIKVELDLPNHATKADLKNATCVDASKFTKKVDLARGNSEVNKLDIEKYIITEEFNMLTAENFGQD